MLSNLKRMFFHAALFAVGWWAGGLPSPYRLYFGLLMLLAFAVLMGGVVVALFSEE